MFLTNANFINICEKVFNPIQFAISKNDGLCNGEVLPTRDILINANSLKSIGRYSADEINEIEKCMSCA